MSSESIAVIIPCYNHARHLPGAVESVLAQTVQPDRIIVVDDGSTDNTAGVARSYSPRIDYVYQDNAGLAAARNTGIDRCNADWLTFLDCDDRWLGGKLQRQLAAAHSDPEIEVVLTDFWHVSPQGDRIVKGSDFHQAGLAKVKWSDLPASNARVAGPRLIEGMLEHFFPCICTAMIKRSVLLQLGGFNNAWRAAEDLDFFLRVAKQGYKFAFIDQPLAEITQHPKSLCRNNAEHVAYRLKVLESFEGDYPLTADEADAVRRQKASCRLALAWRAFDDGLFRCSRTHALAAMRNGGTWRGLKAYVHALPLLRRL